MSPGSLVPSPGCVCYSPEPLWYTALGPGTRMQEVPLQPVGPHPKHWCDIGCGAEDCFAAVFQASAQTSLEALRKLIGGR